MFTVDRDAVSKGAVFFLCRSGVAPSPPMMLLGEWASGRVQRCVLAQVKGHMVCVLSLRLQWTCSLCGSIFRQVVMSSDVFLYVQFFSGLLSFCRVRVVL